LTKRGRPLIAVFLVTVTRERGNPRRKRSVTFRAVRHKHFDGGRAQR